MDNDDCRDTQKTQHGIETITTRSTKRSIGFVETLRKPSTGLKLVKPPVATTITSSRDTQKTQHGIETARKPQWDGCLYSRRDTQKTQHGIETSPRGRGSHIREGRDTQKTQHGIETTSSWRDAKPPMQSRHSENPARD